MVCAWGLDWVLSQGGCFMFWSAYNSIVVYLTIIAHAKCLLMDIWIILFVDIIQHHWKRWRCECIFGEKEIKSEKQMFIHTALLSLLLLAKLDKLKTSSKDINYSLWTKFLRISLRECFEQWRHINVFNSNQNL